MQLNHKIYSLIASVTLFVIVVMMISTWFTARAVKNEIMFDRQVLRIELQSIYKKKEVMAAMRYGAEEVLCEKADFDAMKRFDFIEEKQPQTFIVINKAIKQKYKVTCNKNKVVVEIYPRPTSE